MEQLQKMTSLTTGAQLIIKYLTSNALQHSSNTVNNVVSMGILSISAAFPTFSPSGVIRLACGFVLKKGFGSFSTPATLMSFVGCAQYILEKILSGLYTVGIVNGNVVLLLSRLFGNTVAYFITFDKLVKSSQFGGKIFVCKRV
jgi:hypothetical protein